MNYTYSTLYIYSCTLAKRIIYLYISIKGCDTISLSFLSILMNNFLPFISSLLHAIIKILKLLKLDSGAPLVTAPVLTTPLNKINPFAIPQFTLMLLLNQSCHDLESSSNLIGWAVF